jgi:hypothetical protein
MDPLFRVPSIGPMFVFGDPVAITGASSDGTKPIQLAELAKAVLNPFREDLPQDPEE